MYADCSKEFWKAPTWSNVLSNLYVRLRFVRRFDTAGRRKFYRYIAQERSALERSGIDAEYLRLICRYFSDMSKADRLDAIRRHEASRTTTCPEIRRTLKPLPCDLPPEFRTRERLQALRC